MKQFEIDKLVEDIQDYLHRVAEEEGVTGHPNSSHPMGAEDGLFIPAEARRKMNRFLKFSRYACYLAEALTIGLLTTVIISPFRNWASTAMFVAGVLLFGLFTVTVLLGLQARIRLLLQIESNTQRIAVSKARIAGALEKFRFE